MMGNNRKTKLEELLDCARRHEGRSLSNSELKVLKYAQRTIAGTLTTEDDAMFLDALEEIFPSEEDEDK